MSADHLHFLKNKFILDLEDAEEEHSGENEIPLLTHFQQIRDVLKGNDITASTPIRLKNCLYSAISALAECVVLSEKRERRKKKDGPMHGYTLAEHWLICKTRRLLVQIRRKLTATADAVIPGMTDIAASSSSNSLPVVPIPNSRNFNHFGFPSFEEQVNTILDGLRKRGGFQEIGIVGIGGSGKTTLAQLVFSQPRLAFSEYLFFLEPDRRYFRDYRIWICLFGKLSGDVNFKKMIKDMLKQCKTVVAHEDSHEEEQSKEAAVADDEDFDEDKLLEILGKALEGKRYLMVLDGIWDINIDWYFKLKDKLKSVSSDGHVIITSRLPYKAGMMVSPQNLYCMQPPSTSMDYMHEFRFTMCSLETYKMKLKHEVIERCDGLPLAMRILEEVIVKQILGTRDKTPLYLVTMISCEDDAILGNELLSSCRVISMQAFLAMDVSKARLDDLFQNVIQCIAWKPEIMLLVLNEDAMANQLMQIIAQVVKHRLSIVESNPPILLLPLGSKANISFSLGWEKPPMRTSPKDMYQFLQDVMTKPPKDIDSWGVVLKMKSIPKGFQLPSTFGIESVVEANLRPTESDKEFHATFWNYFIIGLDAEESLQKRDECCGNCYFNPWPRNVVLPICIKTKDQQGEWKEISIPHSTKSIVCLNLPCFPNRPNVKEKYRNFKDPFVNDGLLEVICFRDAWHGDDFLPSKDRGQCLAQVGSIRFEFYNSAINHIHMSIDGNRWKHPLPIEDDNKVIEIYHSGKTKVYVNSNSKCKFK